MTSDSLMFQKALEGGIGGGRGGGGVGPGSFCRDINPAPTARRRPQHQKRQAAGVAGEAALGSRYLKSLPTYK